MEPLAETITIHDNISGFQFGTQSHVINLFADDVVLLFSDPLKSLPPAHKILKRFGEISYYKVNFTKSRILNPGISQTDSDKLQKSLPYSWTIPGYNPNQLHKRSSPLKPQTSTDQIGGPD